MKVHVLLKKEEIDGTKLDSSKTAVIFDVLLATSTMTACFSFGAKSVIPVLDEAEALREAEGWDAGEFCLAGEYGGLTINGFLHPVPLFLKEQIQGKTLILSTTNGTVAVRKASGAKKVWIASLLNGKAAARRVFDEYDGETILVVCSGSNNQFCLEDFYGAGYFISELGALAGENGLELTDSAMAAKLFYDVQPEQGEEILASTRVGRKLIKMGIGKELSFISRKGALQEVPFLDGRKLICE